MDYEMPVMDGKEASAYILENTEPEEVKKAIKAVAENDFYSNELIATAMCQGLTKEPINKPKINSLSGRGIEVLKLTCEELSSKEIAERLNISNRTVQNHRAHLIQKLGFRNTIGMVRFAYGHKLLE